MLPEGFHGEDPGIMEEDMTQALLKIDAHEWYL